MAVQDSHQGLLLPQPLTCSPSSISFDGSKEDEDHDYDDDDYGCDGDDCIAHLLPFHSRVLSPKFIQQDMVWYDNMMI